MMNLGRRLSLMTMAGFLLMASACSTNESEPFNQPMLPPAYQEYFDFVVARTNLTEAQREVLQDGWVTDEEWAGIASGYMSCLADHGIEGSLGTVESMYGVTEASQDKLREQYGDIDAAFRVIDPIIDRCAQSTVDPIGTLYFEPRNNPDGLDYVELVGACMRRVGLDDYAYVTLADISELRTSVEFAFQNPAGSECLTSPSATDWRDGR